MTIFPVQKSAMRCGVCNQLCDRKSRKRIYCDPCGLLRRRETLLAYKKSKRLRDRLNKQPVIIGCACCGVSIRKRTSQHKFCTACREKSDIESRRRINVRFKSTPEARADNARRQRERRAKNPKFAIAARMSASIYQSLNEKKAGRSWESLVGYSLEQLVQHLERQFLSGMSWENHGDWHIDHIRPIALFRFESETDVEFRDCWALSNLRPLWALANKSKNAKRVFLI